MQLNLKKGRNSLCTLNLFVEMQYFPWGCGEERKWQEAREFWGCTSIEENIELFWYYILSGVKSSQWVF